MASGSPLVLLPGTLCDERVWRAQINALSGGWEIIVCALGSEPTLAEEVASLLATLPPRFSLAGFSLGGIAALEFYRQAPQRIERLALIAANARADDEANHLPRRQLAARVAAGDLGRVLRDALLPNYLSPACRRSDALAGEISAMAEATAARFARQVEYACGRPDSRPLLHSIDVPVLILYGEDDRVCPVERQLEMAGAIPHATLHAVPACGHFVLLEAPDVCSAALTRWLEATQQDDRTTGESL
ncbi:Putative aminoacrylate hydrolase RutD [Paraburkholderia aspalathi]|uniref:alpha/beta fold hydrolase n=1 Tax=Paraburkholderia aspalathi TaxID=1324617 RepID=UPI00190AB2FE|nr:alpha/beta hydrolase [Paraburkholderia aspalathi]MBK3843870.1 alpha/beta hydrolase [Paraburkholderia aspalathi]CAE6869832.1 Putative aminoacrylate hydrolase RutD [Paraburkholderia aspalathi]